MSSSRLASRSVRAVSTLEPCIICQSRRVPLVTHRNGAAKPSPLSSRLAISTQVRNYATRTKLDGPRARTEVDARARLGFYTLQKKLLNMEPHIAQSIYHDFIVQKGNMDHGTNVLRLTKKYNVKLDDITSLAMSTFKIPDISDPSKRAQLSPSQHKPVAGMILQGCAQAKDPLAIVHVLTAVYMKTVGSDAVINETARLFPQPEIAKYRKTLDELTLQAKIFALGPDTLTLKGLFLEQEGRRDKAKELYQEAILRSHLKYTAGSRHPMQLPLITPWNALGYMLKADKDPSVQAEAKKYFERGALEGSDPLSYYELSAFEPKTSTKWLQYTSKAAASGHRQAIINLTEFYQEAAKKDSPLLKDSSMRKALNWVLEWRRGSTAALAREWLLVASNAGHKPSTLQLADYYHSLGEHELAKEHLRHMLEPPGAAANQGEDWPQLVQVARTRLAGLN